MATTGRTLQSNHLNPRCHLTSSRCRTEPRTTPLMAFISLIPDPHESVEIRSRVTATSGRLKHGVSIGAMNCKVENSDNVFGNTILQRSGQHFPSRHHRQPDEHHRNRSRRATPARRVLYHCRSGQRRSDSFLADTTRQTPTTPPLVVSTNLPVRPLLLRLLQKAAASASSSRSRTHPAVREPAR